jgi:outer membrane protein, heavy metal efflux system
MRGTTHSRGWPRPHRCGLLRYLATALVAFACPGQEITAPITIDSAVVEAVGKNLDLIAARVEIGIAEAREITARLRPNPELGVSADHLDMIGYGFSLDNGAGPAEYAVGVEYPIEVAGKRKKRITAAEAATRVAQLEFLDAVRSAIFEVQSTFVDALLADKHLSLARTNLQSQERIVDLNRERLGLGDIAEVELLRSRLAALEYWNAVRLAETRYRIAVTSLQKLMGRSPISRSVGVAGQLRTQSELPERERVLKLALERRPDLQALKLDFDRAEADWRLELANAKVDPAVGAEYRRQQGVNGTGNSLGFTFGIAIPVFDRNQGEIARALQERHQAQFRVKALEAAVTEEVENAYEALQAALELLSAIEGTMIREAEDVRSITEYSYKRGEATMLELLDAQRAFNETMRGYHEAQAEFARSLYFIESVTGEAVNP